MSRATFLDFAAVNDRAAATTKKLQKQQILAEYFRALVDKDLPIAVRFASGRAFRATDERVLGVSGSIVSDVILRLTKLDPQEFYDLAVKHGEIGEALFIIWSRTKPGEGAAARPRDPLTLQDIAYSFDRLSSTGNVARKKDILHELFTGCAHAREAAYLAKII